MLFRNASETMVGLSANMSYLLNYDFRQEECWKKGGGGEVAVCNYTDILFKTGIRRLFVPNYNHGYIIYFMTFHYDRSKRNASVFYSAYTYIFLVNLSRIRNNKLLTKVLIRINLLTVNKCIEIKISLPEGNLAEELR